jgi:Ser/Thr protein kinase RdoA (MazF antagonist)
VAPFHARWWEGRSRRSGFPPFGRDPETRQEQYGLQVERFLAEHGASVPPSVCGLVERLRSQLADVVGALYARSRTLIHADLQLDNVLFDARGDASVTVLDWQTVSVGPAAWDVALFLFTSLEVEDRRAAEDDLLTEYVTLLAVHGASDCSVDALRLECRLALLVLLAGTVGWLSASRRGEQTGREHALRHAVLGNGRLVAALADHDVGSLLEGEL